MYIKGANESVSGRNFVRSSLFTCFLLLLLLRVIAHDKPERCNVSMHTGPTTHHSRNFFGELVFSASMPFRLFLLLSFDSQRIHALRVYNWQFYSGSLSSAFSYSTLFSLLLLMELPRHLSKCPPSSIVI